MSPVMQIGNPWLDRGSHRETLLRRNLRSIDPPATDCVAVVGHG